MSTTWHSEALSASMSALECILIEGMHQHRKGREIGGKVTALYVLRGFEPPTQRDWLEDLYKRRNDVIREGASLTEDLDVARVLELTKAVVRWAVHHLNPYHRVPNEPCLTYGDVFDSKRHRDLFGEEE